MRCFGGIPWRVDAVSGRGGMRAHAQFSWSRAFHACLDRLARASSGHDQRRDVLLVILTMMPRPMLAIQLFNGPNLRDLKIFGDTMGSDGSLEPGDPLFGAAGASPAIGANQLDGKPSASWLISYQVTSDAAADYENKEKSTGAA
jgi:hypothetical protein